MSGGLKKSRRLWGEYDDDCESASNRQEPSGRTCSPPTIPDSSSTETVSTTTIQPVPHPAPDESELPPPTDPRARAIRAAALSDGFFRSQQRDEPDLSLKEKARIAGQLFDCRPAQFLARFGKFLPTELLSVFDPCRGDYEVDFWVKELQANAPTAPGCSSLSVNSSNVRVKNRRFRALQNMLDSNSPYFSVPEMRRRNPHLYTQLVGRYLTPEEKEEADLQMRAEVRTSNSLAHILLEHIDRKELERRERWQEECEDNVEERDSDSDSDPGFDEMDVQTEITEEEKMLFRQEYVSAMHQSFLMGKDKDFDYGKVDSDAGLDDMDALDREAEEKYFEQDDDEEDAMENGDDQSGSDELDNFMSTLKKDC